MSDFLFLYLLWYRQWSDRVVGDRWGIADCWDFTSGIVYESISWAKREIRKYEEGFHFCHKRWGLFLYAYIWRPGFFYRDGMVFLSEGMELHIALPDYCEMEDVYFTYSCHKQQEQLSTNHFNEIPQNTLTKKHKVH